MPRHGQPETKPALLSRDRTFRLAKTLKRRGFLTTPSAGRDYVLGSSVWRLSRKYDWSKMLARLAHEPLKTLAAETHETAHLAVRQGRMVLFVDHVTSSHVIAVSGQTGELVPLYCTSHGKALLSDFDGQDLIKLFGPKPLKAYTKNTIQSIRSLAAECKSIREKGFATDESEFLEGVRCVAAPIRDHSGHVTAAISVAAPVQRMTKKNIQATIPTVVAAAEAISRRLGYLPSLASSGAHLAE